MNLHILPNSFAIPSRAPERRLLDDAAECRGARRAAPVRIKEKGRESARRNWIRGRRRAIISEAAFFKAETANSPLRLLTGLSCSPSAASPRAARNSPALPPFDGGRDAEVERDAGDPADHILTFGVASARTRREVTDARVARRATRVACRVRMDARVAATRLGAARHAAHFTPRGRRRPIAGAPSRFTRQRGKRDSFVPDGVDTLSFKAVACKIALLVRKTGRAFNVV